MFSELSNEQLAEITSKFNKLHGAKFIGVNGYESKTGEVSNHTINVNIDVEAAKESDLQTLKTLSEEKLNEIAIAVDADEETAAKALAELIDSAERNLTEEHRTTQSKAQSDTYTSLGKGIRIHKENLNIYITGFANNKEILVEGEHKVVKSRPKTLVKKAIQKELKMSKFRNFKLGEAEALSVLGTTIQLNSQIMADKAAADEAAADKVEAGKVIIKESRLQKCEDGIFSLADGLDISEREVVMILKAGMEHFSPVAAQLSKTNQYFINEMEAVFGTY